MGQLCISRERAEDSNFDFKWLFTPHEVVEEEEAYMIKRQLELDIHNRRINDFVYLTREHYHPHFTQQEYVSLLQNLQLINQDFFKAQQSIQWKRFYKKFQLKEHQLIDFKYDTDDIYFDKTKFLVSMSILTSDSLQVKIPVLFDLLCHKDKTLRD